jgi:outer membrane receptor protein involved in Fe transport
MRSEFSLTRRPSSIRATTLSRVSTIALAAAAGLLAATAAQGAEAPKNDDANTVDAVVVTGSRIERSGFETPTPVTAITQAEIAAKAPGTVVDLVHDIPQLAPNTVAVGSQNVAAAYLNLRGIGASRTLLLVDGRRFAQTSPTGGTDVNVLPASLVKGVDVVTGGASAAYGSDAVAGVVEVTLDNTFEGLKGTLQGGATLHGDAREASGSVGYGRSFAEGRGHFVAAFDGYYNSGVIQRDRDWGRQGWAIIPNPGFAPGNGQARMLITSSVRLSEVTDGGVINATTGPLKNIQFGAGGAILPFTYGQYAGTTFMVGGDGADLTPEATVTAGVNRQVLFSHLSFDFSDKLTGWVDGLYARSEQKYYVIPNYNNGDAVITQQNAFLPAAIKAIMVANNIASFRLGRTNTELGFNLADGVNTTQRYGAGLNGSFGETWKWSAFAQYSSNNYYTTEGNNRREAAWKLAIDSVINPATGQPICRSTLTSPGNGCVPANLFGPNALTPDVVAYASGTSFYDETQSQSIGAVNLTGEPFSNWAGPVSVATGFEYRHEETSGTSDPLSQVAGWRMVNAQPLNGSYNVSEIYFETVVPLLANLRYAKSLDFNGAVRETHYSTSGSVTTWKLGLNYSPNDELRFRGTRSHDIRAPNVNELFQSRGQNNSPINDPVTNQTNQTLVLTGGNPDLDPEIGDTTTAGVVYRPEWLSGLSVSADYYHLRLQGAITTLAPQLVVNGCALGQTDLCSQITRDPITHVITQVFSQQFNAQELLTEGWDFEAAYHFPAEALFHQLDGQFRIRAIATYVGKLVTTVNGVSTDTAGQPTSGGLPHWRGNVTVTYDSEKLTLMAEGRYVGGGLFNSTFIQGVDINDNSVPSRFYINFSAQYQLTEHLQVFGRVSNLLDWDPPIVPNALNEPHAAVSPFFDVVGRDFVVGVRFKF